MCVESLRQEGVEPSGLFDNPNIHPFTEYRARRDALIDYAKGANMALEVAGGYGLRRFVEAVSGDLSFGKRCQTCYALRAEAAALFAEANGFSSFTTTLLISPYQDHEMLRQEMERAAERHSVEFLYRDFRPLFREGQRRAKEMGLYMQKYCGCVFSEEERYNKPPK
jgi:predicted adenine nucleotide alpha hydrolase (AANH) superfamily ATPase